MMADAASLAQTLVQGSAAEKLAAAEALARLEDGASPAAVALVQTLDCEDEQLRDWLVAALEGLGAPSAADVSRLAELVGQPSLDSAYWAATLLGRLQAEAAPATATLTAAVANHRETAVKERAAWALGQIGLPAASARGVLEAAAAEGDTRLARLAREALSQIVG